MEAIKYYVKGAFVGVPETPAALEQQEELISDLTAKVADLVSQGHSEEESLGMAIASMGDLSGLVREFAPEEDAPAASTPAEKPAPVVTAHEVYARRLQLHSVAVGVIGAGATLLLLAVMAGGTSALGGPAALCVLALLGAGVFWLGTTLRRFHEAPDEVATIQVSGKQQVRTAVLRWVAACAGAFLFNLVFQAQGFWAWTIWVAATAWPISVYATIKFVERGDFLFAPAPEAPAADDAEQAVGACA